MMTQEVSRDVTGNAPRHGRHFRAPSRRHVMVTVVASLVLAILLEAGTLVGAPVASPLVLSDWRPGRMVAFFVISVLLVTWLTSTRVRATLGEWVDGLRGDGHAGTKRLARGVVVLCAATVLGWLACALVARLFGVSWDDRYGMVASCLAFCVAALVLLRDTLAGKPEWGFLAVSLAFGTLLCALMPAYSAISFDGFIHYDNSIAMSYLCDAEYTGADVVMSTENASEWAIFTNSPSKSLYTLDDLSTDTTARIDQFLVDSNQGREVTVVEGTSCLHFSSYLNFTMVGHIPNAVGLWLGRLLGLSCLGQFLLGRLASIVFYCLVFFCAMRRLKSGKLILMALALIPSVLILAANYSYDPWCVCLIAYSFARFIGTIQRGTTFTREDVLAIGATFVLGALVKAIYFPLALVFLLAPRELVGDGRALRRYRLGVLAIVVILAASFVIPFLVAGTGGNDTRGGQGIDSAQQVLFILHEPLSYLSVFAGFSAHFLSLDSMEGVLGSLNYAPYLFEELFRGTATLSVFEIAFIFVLSLLDRDAVDRRYAGWRWKLVTLLSVVVSFGLIATALYVSFTPVRNPTIEGVQRRYLFPFLAPLCLVCLNLSFTNNMDRKRFNATALGFEVALLMLMIVFDFVLFM